LWIQTGLFVGHLLGSVADDTVVGRDRGALRLAAAHSAEPTTAHDHVTGGRAALGSFGMSVPNNIKVVLAGLALGIMVVVAGLALAWPARADPDTDFANELHGYGIYGQKDYNAWIAKITCKRLYNGVDADAYKSAAFVTANLPHGTTTAQAWQFLGAAINTYCPEQTPILQRAAEQR
jgi:hypothetical protein